MARKHHRTSKNNLTALTAQLQATQPGQEITVADPQGLKLSETLQELVRPYLPANLTLDIYERVIVTGIMAWNIACGPRETDEAEIEKIVQLLEGEAQARADFRWMLKALIVRKRRAFEANKRRIVQYAVRETASQFHLSIASTAE